MDNPPTPSGELNIADVFQPLSSLPDSTVAERVAELKALSQKIAAERENLVEQIMAATGKVRTDALVSEIMGVLDYLHWLTTQAKTLLKERKVSTPIALFGKKSRIWHEPLGTVLIITPWNYPFHIAMTAIAAAFVAGNRVLLKPSEVTPMHGVFEALFSGFPLLEASVRVVYGDGETGRQLIDQRPDKIFFTGSTRTGKAILKQAAEQLIPVDLELGGKDAMIVFEDVHLERTVAGALWGALTNAGQSCTSVERLYVHESIYPSFVHRLKQDMAELVVNNGDQGDADVGAITAEFQQRIICQHIEQAGLVAEHLPGEPNQPGFVRPVIIEQPDPQSPVMCEETFGPVICVMPFSTEQQVIEHANATPFGLSASVWSKDLDRARRVAQALRVGAVSINNVMLTEGNPALPFGGVGESGFGRSKGAEGLLAFTRSKAVLIDQQSKKIEANWYPYTREKYALFNDLISALFAGKAVNWLRFAIAGLKLESVAQKKRTSADSER